MARQGFAIGLKFQVSKFNFQRGKNLKTLLLNCNIDGEPYKMFLIYRPYFPLGFSESFLSFSLNSNPD